MHEKSVKWRKKIGKKIHFFTYFTNTFISQRYIHILSQFYFLWESGDLTRCFRPAGEGGPVPAKEEQVVWEVQQRFPRPSGEAELPQRAHEEVRVRQDLWRSLKEDFGGWNHLENTKVYISIYWLIHNTLCWYGVYRNYEILRIFQVKSICILETRSRPKKAKQYVYTKECKPVARQVVDYPPCTYCLQSPPPTPIPQELPFFLWYYNLPLWFYTCFSWSCRCYLLFSC